MIIYILDYLGYYAPVIMALITSYMLLFKKTYFTFFIIGLFFNNIFNVLLKLLIKEPRPNGESKIVELAVKHGLFVSPNRLGMPSGHLQNCFYILLFSLFTIKNMNINILFLILSMICAYQRYITNNHSIFQLLVGALVGSVIGYLMWYFANKKIKGDTRVKPDDNAPK